MYAHGAGEAGDVILGESEAEGQRLDKKSVELIWSG